MPNILKDWLNRIHQGDCLELMRQLPDECVDLVVTSPPYNLAATTGGGVSTMRPYCDCMGFTDDMPRAEYIAWQRECIHEMLRLLKPGGAIFYNHKNRVQGGLEETPLEILAGFPARQEIVWVKDTGINRNPGYFHPRTERIYIIAKPGFALNSDRLGDVWDMRADKNPKHTHPRPFPLDLPRRAIGATDAQVILDPFCGSGTTAVAARLLGRQYIGMELCSHYCDMARERVAGYRAEEPRSVEQRVQRGLTLKTDGGGKVQGLSRGESAILRAIAQKCAPLGEAVMVRLSELAEEVDLYPTTVSKLLKKLAAAGLVSRKQTRGGIIVDCLVNPWTSAAGGAMGAAAIRPRRSNPGYSGAAENGNPAHDCPVDAAENGNPGYSGAAENGNPAHPVGGKNGNPGYSGAAENGNPAHDCPVDAAENGNPGYSGAAENGNPAPGSRTRLEKINEISLTGSGIPGKNGNSGIPPPCPRCGAGTLRITKWKSIRAVTDSYGGVLWYCQGQANRCSYCVHIGADGAAKVVVGAYSTELNELLLADRLTQLLAAPGADDDPDDPLNFTHKASYAASIAEFEKRFGRTFDYQSDRDGVDVLNIWRELYLAGEVAERSPV